MTDRENSHTDRIPAVNIDAHAGVGSWVPENSGVDEKAERKIREHYALVAEHHPNRRQFMKMMVASLGAAGIGSALAGCVKAPDEEIIPYVNRPETVVPGNASYYSSVFTRNGYGYGVIAESHQGRPTKIEGNPAHPASLGATDVFMQAELLNLYDPDRSRAIEENGRIRSYGDLQAALLQKMNDWSSTDGQGLHILTPQITSPSLTAQIHRLTRRYPEAHWHQWQPVNDDTALKGARLAFGQDLTPQYHLEKADIIVQLDGDLLTELPGSLHYARDFAKRREPLQTMSRIYAIESTPGLSGAMADHRLAANAAAIHTLAYYLAVRVMDKPVPADAAVSPTERQWLETCARDLRAHPGRSLVVAGVNQPAAVHALAYWLNDYLDNREATVVLHKPVAQQCEVLTDSLRALTNAMAGGRVDSLLMLDCNPVFNAPANFEFSRNLRRVKFSVHLGSYRDETATQCDWHIPRSHPLESWGDARAFDGTVAIQQPLISPLYETFSSYTLLAFLCGDGSLSDYECVQRYWRSRIPTETFEIEWREMLTTGKRAHSAAEKVNATIQPSLLDQLHPPDILKDELILQFAADPRLWDGTYANNAWLQELPQPLTTLTWGNALLMSPMLAKSLHLKDGDVVEVCVDEKIIQLPACVLPGHAENAVSVTLGHGREILSKDGDFSIGSRIGQNAYPLRRSSSLWFRSGVSLKKTGDRVPLARTQSHDNMEDRHPVRHTTLEKFTQDLDLIRSNPTAHNPTESLYEEPHPEGFSPGQYQWGMSIDLNACIGCGACTIACQAENNIPVVGREQVLVGREMHWLRIDRYYSENISDGVSDGENHNVEIGEKNSENASAKQSELRTLFQPMLCQHCENAPCEYVCPVGATVHDYEGLNVMVYNRCIGTRDCSQNCPYKVRRFNFLDYNYGSSHTVLDHKAIAPVRNPNVTVRSRGVMEKCTYCVQRISGARINAKIEMRDIQDQEVVTACQQACPTQAIAFGNIDDENAQVSKAKHHPLSYGVLTELNTRPRTTYIARIHNVNYVPLAATSSTSEGRGGPLNDAE